MARNRFASSSSYSPNKRSAWLRVSSLLALCFSFSQSLSAESIGKKSFTRSNISVPLHITLINPYNNPFWECADKFAKTVAGDLGLDLESIHAEHRLVAQHAMEDVIERKNKPEYLIMQYYTGTSARLLKDLDYAGIKSFVINTDSPKEEKRVIGKPRQFIPNWLGHMYPDDFYIGQEQAEQLIALAKDGDKTVEMIGIGGAPRTTAGTLRNEGARFAASNNPKVKLNRMVFTQWQEHEGEQAAFNLLKQYPETRIIWTGSDNIAAGAIKAALQLGYKPGENIFVGGVDCSANGLELIKQGHLSLSLCGHFLEVGWAIITLFDYYHGIDFKEDLGTVINLPVHAITQLNWRKYEGLVCDSDWQHVNFKHFSKYYNKALTQYDFGMESLRRESEKGKKAAEQAAQALPPTNPLPPDHQNSPGISPVIKPYESMAEEY
ncbi:Ribose import binding protein RbsB [Thalassocella blandensis]|nr:Ribose import binding protein RbsB [Thalassocella blandensis]